MVMSKWGTQQSDPPPHIHATEGLFWLGMWIASASLMEDGQEKLQYVIVSNFKSFADTTEVNLLLLL